MKRLLMLAMVVVMALGILTGCGGGGGGGGAAKEITIEMGTGGQWRFNPDKVEVKAGETVKVNLVNKDTTQAHSFVITALNVKSQQIGAGKTGSVTFKADKAGNYQYFCDVPGHKEGGMVGTLTVK